MRFHSVNPFCFVRFLSGFDHDQGRGDGGIFHRGPTVIECQFSILPSNLLPILFIILQFSDGEPINGSSETRFTASYQLGDQEC